MGNEIDQQTQSHAQKKTAEHTTFKRVHPVTALTRIEATSTQLYVLGGLVVSIGSVIGLASPFINWCLALLGIGGLIIIIGLVLHRRATHNSEILETLDLDNPKPIESTLHPDIVVRLKFYELVENQPMGMEFELHNVGTDTAFKYGIDVNYKTFEVPVKSVPISFDHILKYPIPNYVENAGEKIPKDGKKYVNPIKDGCPTLTPKLIKGDDVLFVFGVFWYADRNGNRTIEKYCRTFNPKTPTEPFDCPAKIRNAMIETENPN